MEQETARGLVNVLTGGDEANPEAVELLVDLHVICPVAGEPVELVHDDVVNVLGLLFEIPEHLLQRRSVGGGSGDAPLDELFGDHGPN
nr:MULTISPECIES: hypothetical protein [unclassified Leucobacter]